MWGVGDHEPVLSQDRQGMVDFKKVSLLPLGGFGKDELLLRCLKCHRAESPPSGV